MHVKPPDDMGLEELVPTVWWATLENVSLQLYPPLPKNPQALQPTRSLAHSSSILCNH